MKTINRGHETQEHRALKSEVAEILQRCGYGPILCEHQFCDVVGRRASSPGVLAIEVERSKRNVLRNVTRDFEQGATAVLVVCPDFSTAAEVARALDRNLPPELRERTGLLTSATLRALQSFCPQIPNQKDQLP